MKMKQNKTKQKIGVNSSEAVVSTPFSNIVSAHQDVYIGCVEKMLG